MTPMFSGMRSVPARKSLRLRLLLLSIVVEVVMLTLLVANSVRLIHDHLARNTTVQLEAQQASFNIALAGLLAARDYASIQSVLDGWGNIHSITYMAVEDSVGRVVAATGMKATDPLPSPDRGLDGESGVYNGAFDITYLNQRYGRAHYGLDTAFIGVARRELLQQSLGIAIVEIVLTVALLTAIGFWLTRHLELLARASLKVADGDFSQRLDVDGEDEIAVLTRTFNVMSGAVEARISELKDSERRFRAIADYTYSWENWFDSNGRLRWVNPAVERIVGYSPQVCHGMAGFPLPMVVEQDRDRVADCLEKARCGESGDDVQFRVRAFDGQILWVAMSWQPIFDPSGAPLGSRSSIRDITAQKQSADLLIEAKAELERMLFAASHDLQEPIREIQAYSQRLQREFAADLPERAQTTITTIADGAAQMNLLVGGLVKFSRSNRPKTAFSPVAVRNVVDQAIADCRNAAPGVDASFEIGDLPSVPGDAVLLFIVFESLIGNALKFHRPGVAPIIRIYAVEQDGGWRIDVADNGIGIPSEYLESVLRPFARLHSRAKFPGAGLGLASAARIAGLHGGRLWLDSVPDKGTTAHLWLPSAGLNPGN
ncbi:hypothetical protein CU669_04310 [Paramagnetospirillum kuznetsovii]|uniref:histidine kinase n=1 Tax=Paramagnetospirillum kuznetsovii TaxID=2053833 RepID=A0A364P219_9PROT|nr:ATP-binding protein [Paramagnetospirillum kuznetsovii]RAU23361.1 hypothetical protein CU669_04310 [Paramagnetospirillum kuznetsovii]